MSKLCSCSQENSSVLRIPRSKHKVHTWCTVFNWVSKILSCVHSPVRKYAPFYNQKFNLDGSSTTHLFQLVFLLPFWFLVFFMDLVFFFLRHSCNLKTDLKSDWPCFCLWNNYGKQAWICEEINTLHHLTNTYSCCSAFYIIEGWQCVSTCLLPLWPGFKFINICRFSLLLVLVCFQRVLHQLGCSELFLIHSTPMESVEK